MADQVTLQIRKATQADANDIARIHTVSWQSIYRGHFPDDYLDNIDVDRRSSTWRKLASKASDELVVGEVSSLMVGFLHLTKSRDADGIESTDEVTAIYLDPAFWRNGYGRTLMEWALESSRGRNASRVTLWVLEANSRARLFYEDLGFRFAGSMRIERLRGGFEFTEVRHEYELGE